MAVTVDQANIYTGAGAGQTNHLGTTTAAVASGAVIVILAHRFRSGGGGVYTGTGGGLTWAALATAVVSGNIGIYLLGAIAPAGLASGTTNFGVNSTVGSNDYTVCAGSLLGVDTSGGIAGVVRAFGGASAATAAWATGVIAGSAGDCYIGGAGADGTLRTSTATSGTELIDFNSATSSGSVTLVDKIGGGASDNLAGTWSGAITHVAIGAALIPAGGGGGGATFKPSRALMGVGF